MLGIPELPEIREWAQIPASVVSDDTMTAIRDAELALQSRTLRIPPDPADDGSEAVYPAPLARALLRRCQREIASRQLPLGMVGDTAGEFGAAYLRSWDPEVRRLEDPYRIAVIA